MAVSDKYSKVFLEEANELPVELETALLELGIDPEAVRAKAVEKGLTMRCVEP